MNLLAEACELVGRVEVEHRETLSVHLRRQNQIRSIHASLHIEQNTLTQEQITAILDGKRVLGPPQEILEVKNAAEAYALLQELNPLAERDLLRAHRAMMQSLVREAGCFRKGGVGVMAGDRVIHIAPPAHLVPYQIRDLLSWYGKSKLHPLLKSSVFHYEFEFIHPFADGNGRMGRLWHTLLLSRWRSFFAWLPIEELIAERQQEYYRVLQEADSRGECSCFVQLMLEVIRDTLSQFSATSRPAGDLAGAENDQAAAKNDQAAAKNDQAGAKSDQAGAKSDQAGSKSDQAGAKSDQAGAKSDQAGAKSDQAAAKSDQAAIKLPPDTTAPVRELLEALGQDTLSAAQLMEKLGLQHRANFRQRYLAPALACGFVLRTLPDTPNSPNQRYRAADRG